MGSPQKHSYSDDPAILVSHSRATDDLGRHIASVCASLGRFQFLESTGGARHNIAGALTSVLGIRAPGRCPQTPADVSEERLCPIVVQVCAAAEKGDTAKAIEETARTIRHEFNRSLLTGTNILVVYLGAANGMLPKQQFIEGLKSIDRLFDLVVVVSDSDSRARRYLWPDIATVISRFVGCFLQSASLRQFLFDVAASRDPRNRRVTFGLATFDVAADTVRSLAYSYLFKALSETLFPRDEKEETPAILAMDSEYLSSRYRSTGALGPVVSALEPAGEKLACNWKNARARELAQCTKGILSARRDAFLEKPRWRLPRALDTLRRFFRREHSQSKPPQGPKTGEMTEQKAKLFAKLLRLKQIELELQPAMGVPQSDSSFPLNLSLADLPIGEHKLLADLANVKGIALSLARELSLEDLLSGRVSAKDLAKRIDTLWDEHLVPEKTAAFLASREYGHFLQLLSGRVSPLSPSAGSDEARLILAPPDAACTTQVEGFQTAVGFPGQYILIVATECSDRSFLDCLGVSSDG